jgi:F0F1-type ATP synthase membrane subunit c/vacuolar-type H+-ATPase subunit K
MKMTELKRTVCAALIAVGVFSGAVTSSAQTPATANTTAVNAVEYEADTSPAVTGIPGEAAGIVLEKQLPEISEQKKNTNNPPTGIIIAVVPAILALAALVVSVIINMVKKKKK